MINKWKFCAAKLPKNANYAKIVLLMITNYTKNYAGTIYQGLLPKRIYPAYIFSSIVRTGKKEKWGHKDNKISNISSFHQMNSPNFVFKVTVRPFTSRSKLPLSLIWGLEKKKLVCVIKWWPVKLFPNFSGILFDYLFYDGGRITFAVVDFWHVYPGFVATTKNSTLIKYLFKQSFLMCSFVSLGFLKLALMPWHLHS